MRVVSHCAQLTFAALPPRPTSSRGRHCFRCLNGDARSLSERGKWGQLATHQAWLLLSLLHLPGPGGCYCLGMMHVESWSRQCACMDTCGGAPGCRIVSVVNSRSTSHHPCAATGAIKLS